ncbi:putative RNA methyltransferase NOL1 [Nosema bombycis CQ1]|uniref:Putative RNA methyltransferase NOL1 n=1 Tax=Nosema bombycis (strain CQ1 / CVCC 102059) TaxID=578461 RepID=R0MRA5_NOSB1|nr:putative RNA methyltransferase NOL1 [Nosema bombycis CQ1]|eukprot:EOB15413.1 putative RNA methyltransferase NOL1 [Nosema bombycis CQ1]
MIENSYNDFLKEKIFELFPKKEALAFMEESEKRRPVTIRTNTLISHRKDVHQKLGSRGVDLDALEWSDVGSVIYNSSVPLGATPEYLAGYYMIQGGPSMLAVANLDLKEDLKVVDMCAAPGGKTTYIAALMNNTGVLYSNDINEDRIVALKSNILRMNVQNCIVTNYDGRKLNVGMVDRVLLDAPCSGTGIISKDPSVKTSRSKSDLDRTVLMQKELLLHSFDMLKPNGFMVYSTCSVLPKENEEVVSFLLSKRDNAKVVQVDIDVGKPGFPTFRGKPYHPSMSLTRRIYPHVHNMDGFYYAKIQKIRK